jgi:hypothetical protein
MGPIQAVVIAYGPDANFEGKAIAELQRLEETDTVRLLDLLFVQKDESGDLLALDIQGDDLGAIAGALLGFEFDDAMERPEVAELKSDGGGGLSQQDLDDIAASLEPGYSAAVVLLEHVWARGLRRAVREAGGTLVTEGFLTPEAIAAVALELTAISQEIEKERAAAAV